MEEKIKKELLELEEELQKLSQTTKQIEDVKNFSKEIVDSVSETQKKIGEHLSKMVSHNEDVVVIQEEISNKILKLIESNTTMIDKIDRIDFPSRLDKIDVSVSSINQSNLNILMKLENMEKSIKEDSDRKIEKINESIINQNKSIKYIIIGLVIVFAMNIAILILK